MGGEPEPHLSREGIYAEEMGSWHWVSALEQGKGCPRAGSLSVSRIRRASSRSARLVLVAELKQGQESVHVENDLGWGVGEQVEGRWGT